MACFEVISNWYEWKSSLLVDEFKGKTFSAWKIFIVATFRGHHARLQYTNLGQLEYEDRFHAMFVK